MTIVAAADGSALGNPGPAGWAWYVDDTAWAAGGWPHGTNNQGELMAVIDLLESTADEPDDLRILCDSQYVINAVTKWMPGWKRKGWRKADGSPVLNRELLERLDAALSGRRYRFEWVKGHAGHDLNEAADERARAVATAYQRDSAVPSGPGWRGVQHVEPPVAATAPVAAAFTPATLFDADFDDDLAETTAAETVARLERELLEPGTRTDPARVAALLHPDFEEIGASGHRWGRDTSIEELTDATGAVPARLDVLDAEPLTTDAVLLTVRATDARGATLRTSLWLRDNGAWRLRFRQGTPSAE
jgi:ribonuclease HI